jgi:hypothetical protein
VDGEPESGGVEQRGVLRDRPLAAAEQHQHVQVHPYCRRIVDGSLGDDRLDDDQQRFRPHRRTAGAEDAERVGVVPVVQRSSWLTR